MAKSMTKNQIVAALADKVGISKQASAAYLDELMAMALREAKNGFTLPGVGKLALRSYKERLYRDPRTGEEKKVPPKKVLKFQVARSAKDAILNEPPAAE